VAQGLSAVASAIQDSRFERLKTLLSLYGLRNDRAQPDNGNCETIQHAIRCTLMALIRLLFASSLYSRFAG
jgi:hypothetical protein